MPKSMESGLITLMVGGELVLSYSMKTAGLQNNIFYYITGLPAWAGPE